MSFNSPAAAVGCYSTGEEIANSVTHGVAALLSIAGLVVMLSMMPVTAGAATITAAAVFGASMISTRLRRSTMPSRTSASSAFCRCLTIRRSMS